MGLRESDWYGLSTNQYLFNIGEFKFTNFCFKNVKIYYKIIQNFFSIFCILPGGSIFRLSVGDK